MTSLINMKTVNCLVVLLLTLAVVTDVTFGRYKRAAKPSDNLMTTSGQVIDHTKYHKYNQIVNYTNILRDKYPDNVIVHSMEELTYENRSVALVKIFGDSDSINKSSIIIEAGIHAREWISPAATLYFLETLLQNYKTGDTDAKFLLDTYTWYIVPVANPDGYEFTHTSILNRFWRKNRRQINEYCIGVDLNRNFGKEFDNDGIECVDEVYPGDKAFSESESRNLRNLFNKVKQSAVAYIAVHSYGQLMSLPWSYKADKEASSPGLERIAKLMSAAIKENSGKEYTVGTTYALMEVTAKGSSKDWTLSQNNDLFSITLELPPMKGTFLGFMLSSKEIVPTGKDLFACLLAMARELSEEGKGNH